jgi:hypothetical protein
MMIGAMAGMAGIVGIFLLLTGVSQLTGGRERKTLTDLLKASHRDQSPIPNP